MTADTLQSLAIIILGVAFIFHLIVWHRPRNRR